MKAIIAVLVLLLVGMVAGESQDTEEGGISGTLSSANPFLLIIAGAILYFASNLAKAIGVILVIIGILNLLAGLV